MEGGQGGAEPSDFRTAKLLRESELDPLRSERVLETASSLLFVVPRLPGSRETCWEPSPVLRGANTRVTILERLHPAA